MAITQAFTEHVNVVYGPFLIIGCASDDGTRINRVEFNEAVSDLQKSAIMADAATFQNPPTPDVAGAKTAVLNDATIEPQKMIALIKIKGLLDDYPISPSLVKKAWFVIKLTGEIDAETASKVEAHCAEYGMPLI